VAQSAFMQARQMLSVQKTVGFAIARDATEPVLMGIGRPLVILPESLETSLSPAELNTVLLHELAHFMRGDNLTGSLAHLVATAFWFHPLLWWMERQLSIDCEYACDEVVLALTRKPSDYASGIVKATRFAVCGAVAGVSGIGGYQFRKRLELIMSQDKNPVAPRRGRSLVTAAVMALVVVPVIGGFMSKSLLQGQTIEKRRGIEFITATASSDTPQTQQILSALKTVLNPNDTVFPVNGNDRWDKWLNEDVALLITQEERSAFLALTSESPREQFVTQFWEKRNPNPGSAVNTFKDEHYRRMAYANKRFTLQQVAGWQTDRGRTYVLMGPPDEIDSHPDQNRETWKYNLRGTPDSIAILFDISDRH
jgi:GWxTD domain-containing protein